MKIKADFVTNSSSTSYFVIPSNKEQLKKAKSIMRKKSGYHYNEQDSCKYPKIFKNLIELIEYTQGDKYTWIEGIKNRPYCFNGLSEEQFEKCRWFVEQGFTVLYGYVPNENEGPLCSELRKIQLDCSTFILDDVFIVPLSHHTWKEYLSKKRKEYRKKYGYDDDE